MRGAVPPLHITPSLCDKGEGKVVPVLNKAPRHEAVLSEWRYSSTHSCSLHSIELNGQLQAPAALQ